MHTGSYISVLLLPFQLIIAPDQPAHEQLMRRHTARSLDAERRREISLQGVYFTTPVCEVKLPSSISGRSARSPLFDIYIIPFFLSETATRSRVAIPDTAIAESWMSPLGGGVTR
jgi:hypothetical protein